MKKHIKKILHLSGYYTMETTDIIADITSLFRKYKVSIDDIKMTTFDKNSYQAMISSSQFPDKEHVFWNELYDMSENRSLNINLINKEDQEIGFTNY